MAATTTTTKMTVWQAPSGRLHLRASCSGGAGPSRMTKIRVTQEQFTAATRCRCLPTWKAN
jgi:hypothetical protein